MWPAEEPLNEWPLLKLPWLEGALKDLLKLWTERWSVPPLVAKLLELVNVLPPPTLPRLLVTVPSLPLKEETRLPVIPRVPPADVVLSLLRLKIEEAAFLVAVELNAVVREKFVHE